MMIGDYKEVLNFWFNELKPADHYRKDKALDQDIRSRFGKVHLAASRGECFTWRSDPKGRLAEIIVLDQFSRNIFRDLPQAFASDPMALVLSQEAVLSLVHKGWSSQEKSFLLMPYMHSESPLVHEQALVLFAEPGLEGSLDYEIRHKKIIDRFGRYPHRNGILGRVSTPEEIEFLKEPGSSF